MLYLIIYLKLFRIIFAETKYILPYDVEISSDIDSIINWRYKSDYYYPNLNGKINQIFDKKCREKHLIILDDNIIQVPNSSDHILISSFRPSDNIVKYWKDIVKPLQMRQEPLLCDSPKTRRRPIFDAQGCQVNDKIHLQTFLIVFAYIYIYIYIQIKASPIYACWCPKMSTQILKMALRPFKDRQ